MSNEKQTANANTNVPINLLSARYLANAEMRAKMGPQRLKLARATVAYCRRSKEVENLSIDRQKERAAAYAKVHLNDDIARFYVDEGITGETAVRPDFEQMMKDAQAGLFDVIVVEDVDRVGRSFGVIGNSWDIFKELGIKLHTVFKGGEVSNVDIAFKTLAATEHQVALRDRSRDGVDRAISEGRVVGALPFGYVRHPYKKGVFQIDEAMRPCIEWMYEARLQGMSVFAILRGLHEMAPPNSNKLPSSISQIARTFKNTIYKGVFTFRKCEVRKKNGKRWYNNRPPSEWRKTFVPHMKIVDEDKWNRVYDSFRGVSQKQRGIRFLSEKVFCGECGLRMRYGSTYRSNHNFECFYARKQYKLGQTGSCPMGSVVAAPVHEAVLRSIRETLSGEWQEEEYQNILDQELDEQRKAIEKRRGELEVRRDALKENIKLVADKMSLASIPKEIAEEEIRNAAHDWREAVFQLDTLPDLKKRLLIESTRRATLLEVFDRIVANVHLHERDLSTQERMERAVLRRLIVGVKLDRMPGTQSIRIVIELSNADLLGVRLPEGSAIPATKTFIGYVHRWGNSQSEEAISAYREGIYGLSDAEWEIVSSRFAGDLSEVSLPPELGIRELTNLLVFAGSISIRRRYLRTYRLVQSQWGMVALGRLIRSGLWKRIFDCLETNFASRRHSLNPDLAKFFLIH